MIGQVIQAMKVTGNVDKMATKSSKNEMPFAHPLSPEEIGMGQEWYGNRLGMGQVQDKNGPGMGQIWDRMILVDFMQMMYYPADSCAISPSAFLFSKAAWHFK